MNRNDRWVLEGEDLIRANTLAPLFVDEPVISIVENLNQKAHRRFQSNHSDYNNAISLHNIEGLPCQILKYGSKKWMSGKIRYVLEFEPDNLAEMLEVQASMQEELTESITLEEPLDEIRKLSE